jgi:hypothetical protein
VRRFNIDSAQFFLQSATQSDRRHPPKVFLGDEEIPTQWIIYCEVVLPEQQWAVISESSMPWDRRLIDRWCAGMAEMWSSFMQGLD